MAKFKPWGEQTFLNRPLSSSSGWMKMAITRDYRKDVSVTMLLADCSTQIALEFYINFPRINAGDSKKSIGEKINASYASLARRRLKAKRMRGTLERFFDNLELAYQSFEKDLDKLAKKNGFEVEDYEYEE